MNYYSSGPVVIFPFLYLRAKLRTKKVRITCRNFVKWLRRRFAAIASGSGSAADATIGILWHPGVRCCCRCCCRCHCSVERSAKKEHIQCSFTPGFYKPMSRVRSITILVRKVGGYKQLQQLTYPFPPSSSPRDFRLPIFSFFHGRSR